HGELDFEGEVFSQRCDDVIFVDHGDGRVALDHPCGDRAGLAGGDLHCLGFIRVELHDQTLDVEDDIADIFDNALKAGELVISALDTDMRNGCTFERAQKNATQAVTHSGTKSAFKRFDHEFTVIIGGNLVVTNHSSGQFKPAPSNTHNVFLQKLSLN